MHIPLVPSFDRLETTTLTVVSPLEKIQALNLPAIFALLPVAKIDLSVSLPKGKFRYPKEWNMPGQIISMRYGPLTRGYKRKRKKDKEAFPTAITLDIGTHYRPVNIKFSQTMKITGAPNFLAVKEAIEGLLNLIKDVQNVCLKEKETPNTNTGLKWLYDSFDPEEHGQLKNFLDQFDGVLYQGELQAKKYQLEMINMAFDLGLMVNRKHLAEIVNQEPFNCWYNNVVPSRKLLIYHYYPKVTKKSKISPGKQTIKVVDTGHALFSGPNPDQMRLIYNTFMLRLLQNYDYVTSSVQNIREINVHKGTKMSNDEWLALRKEELQYTLDLTSGKLPMYEKEFTSEKYVVWADKLPVFGYRSMSWEDNFNDTESESESESESED